jgi:excisionase family DNA binding protein
MTDLRIVTISADELDARIEAAVEAAVKRVVAQLQTPTEWIDADSAARLLGVSTTSVRRLARSGELPHARVGGLLRFDRAAIDERLRRVG